MISPCLCHSNFTVLSCSAKTITFFWDRGCCNHCCRSIMAEAMFNKVLQKMESSGTPLDAVVESASLGPSFLEHDPRVIRLAREAGLRLAPKTNRCFKEVKDPVEFDLIVVMDKFDYDEVKPCAQCYQDLKWSFLTSSSFQRPQILTKTVLFDFPMHLLLFKLLFDWVYRTCH